VELDPLEEAPLPFIDKAMRLEPGGNPAFHGANPCPAQPVRRGRLAPSRMGSPDRLLLLFSIAQEGGVIHLRLYVLTYPMVFKPRS